jgi:catechol 2,3-dioxygenase-like lactoylglutathione lyase family enzyme
VKLEHIAFNVSAPVETAEWYAKYLDMEIVFAREDAPFTRFLADESGQITLEFYNNPPDQVPDYKSMNPQLLHIAFVSKDPDQDQSRLLAAGATFVSDEITPLGTRLVMLRDPWGLPLQLCNRKTPMLKNV